MEITTVIKKPVKCEALQFQGTEESKESIQQWLGPEYVVSWWDYRIFITYRNEESICIAKGIWLVKEPGNKPIAVSNEDFLKEYEECILNV